MVLSAGKVRSMRRISDAEGQFKMSAVDQRLPIKNLIKERRQLDEAPWEDEAAIKSSHQRCFWILTTLTQA